MMTKCPRVEMEKPCAVCGSRAHFSERRRVKVGIHDWPILTCPDVPPTEIRLGDQTLVVTLGVAGDNESSEHGEST